MNFEPIRGRPCRIMWSQRDPTVRRSGVGNIFIKNLDVTVDNKALYDTFSQFGNILSCKVVQNAEGQSRGYAFVHFETQQGADLAIQKVNGMELKDKMVFVGHFKTRTERAEEASKAEREFLNIYVKSFPGDFTEDNLKTMVRAAVSAFVFSSSSSSVLLLLLLLLLLCRSCTCHRGTR